MYSVVAFPRSSFPFTINRQYLAYPLCRAATIGRTLGQHIYSTGVFQSVFFAANLKGFVCFCHVDCILYVSAMWTAFCMFLSCGLHFVCFCHVDCILYVFAMWTAFCMFLSCGLHFVCFCHVDCISQWD